MNKDINIKPFKDELPSHLADRLGVLYSSSVTTVYKKEKGQFFTPVPIANFMSNMSSNGMKEIKILDPGCGTGVLFCSLLENIATNHKIRTIELVTYESDYKLIPYTTIVIDYLKSWLNEKNIKITVKLNKTDYILDNKDYFINQNLFKTNNSEKFDIVISNPPYFKLNKKDKRAIVASSITYGQPNIYSIFMFIAAKMLKQNGELIFITPRSFTSGNYFRLFREYFFNEVQINRIHLFNSRKTTFKRDSVLQELLILKAIKKIINETNFKIDVTYSESIKDIDKPTKKEFFTNELIDFNSKEKILHLPVSEQGEKVIKLFKSWKGSLNKYNIQISTGPVVSFRARKYLFENNKDKKYKYAPLFQLQNATKMSFDWPIEKNNKPQYIRICEESQKLLLPNKNYIFLRRFSSKDDKSRLIASPYFVDNMNMELIGVENHLNYIYRPKGNLERNEIMGLSALLNSTIFDTYFRTFNGNINVSATELREMPLPDLEIIKKVGNEIILKNKFSDTFTNELVNKQFNLENLF